MSNRFDSYITSIYRPIEEGLVKVEDRLVELSSAGGVHMPELLNHVLHGGGKRVRPAITLLASRVYPNDGVAPIIMATAVELLHIASLIHDDTVDNSDTRRGKATISGLWGKNVAVLLGDYVFATSATFVCDTGNIRVIRRFSETIMELSSGQLLEYFNNNARSLTRDDYNEQIYLKTASLFQTAAETGAVLSGAPEATVVALKNYGYNIGMAFQIVDDILDVEGDSHKIGKPVGNDLAQGILTLPAIMFLERYPDNNPINDLFEDTDKSTPHLNQVLDTIQKSGIIGECYQVVRDYCDKALAAIEVLEKDDVYASLFSLAHYVTDRNH